VSRISYGLESDFKICFLKIPKLGVLKCEELIGLEGDWRFYQFSKKILEPESGFF
jgi:hypothetical protein